MRPTMPLIEGRRNASAPVAAAAAPASAPKRGADQAEDQEEEQQREEQPQESEAKAPGMEAWAVAVVWVRPYGGITSGLAGGHLAGLRHSLRYPGVVDRYPNADHQHDKYQPEHHSPDRSSVHRLLLVMSSV